MDIQINILENCEITLTKRNNNCTVEHIIKKKNNKLVLSATYKHL